MSTAFQTLQINPYLLLTLGVIFFLILFFIAIATEKKWLPKKLIHHPVVYSLSIGVYCSTLAFYGSVDMASHYGYSFLLYYIGFGMAFIFAPLLLSPIHNISETYQLNSLADLLAFRFRSTLVGTLTALMLLIAILPLMSLQIHALANTVHLLNQTIPQDISAFWYCVLICIFAMLASLHQSSAREKHEGLIAAVAFSSLLKLIILLIIGAYCVFFIFNGFSGLETWLQQNFNAIESLHTPVPESTVHILLLTFFTAAIAMPHVFHISITENVNSKSLATASWGVPLFLTLISFPVLPILWGNNALGLSMGNEYATLLIGLKSNSVSLSLLAFIGTLTAASAIFIVAAVSLASICVNHLILPVHRPQSEDNFYRRLKWMRLLFIFIIVSASYLFYWMKGIPQHLSTLGLISFTATLQFLPGIVAIIYCPSANSRGFIIGLCAGFTIWFIILVLPVLKAEILFSDLSLLSMVSDENWTTVSTIALLINISLFVIVSLLRKNSEAEQNAADACSLDNLHNPNRRNLVATTAEEFIEGLAKPLGNHMAEEEVGQALKELNLAIDEHRPYALRRLRSQIETNLSGHLGSSVARELTDHFLPFEHETTNSSSDFHLTEIHLEKYHSQLTGLAIELDKLRRHHRQILEDLPLGVCSLGVDHEILMWNTAMANLTHISAHQVIGSNIRSLVEPWSSLLLNFSSIKESHAYKKTIQLEDKTRWINLHKANISKTQSRHQMDGLIILVEDLTETQMIENELTHNERLASIGRLAAGVAHEIGNPVTGIACLSQNLRDENHSRETQISAEQILGQTKRISAIVQTLVSFAHSGEQHNNQLKSSVNLYQCINEAVQLLSLNKDKDIRFNNQCPNNFLVCGDHQRLLQIFINLLNNAQDASRQGQKVLIEGHEANTGIIICIIDEGHGIPEQIRERIFEPFFTTKEPGQGTGLGLSLVHSIIDEHGGNLDITSPVDKTLGKGTKVVIELPKYSKN